MYWHNNSVGGAEEDRGERFICECRKVRGRRRHHDDWCGCSKCKHDRDQEKDEVKFVCECREDD